MKATETESDSSSGEETDEKEPSVSSSGAESESEDDERSSIADSINGSQEVDDVQLKVMDNFSPEMLKDEDNELWLVRMPRFKAFVDDLAGREIEIIDDENVKIAESGTITGKLRGYYVVRDFGTAEVRERAAFVTRDQAGKEQLEIVKPFARAVNVTFDAPMKDSSHKEPPCRKYPVFPKGLKLQYRPIGAEREEPRKKSSGSALKGKRLNKGKTSSVDSGEEELTAARQGSASQPNGSVFDSAKTKKRKRSAKHGIGEEEPSMPREEASSQPDTLTLYGAPQADSEVGAQKPSRRRKSTPKRRIVKLGPS